MALFPARLRCPRCGAEAFASTAVGSGVLEETTVLLHVAGRAGHAPMRLGTVLTAQGARLIARLEDGAERGARVALSDAAGAIVARLVTV